MNIRRAIKEELENDWSWAEDIDGMEIYVGTCMRYKRTTFPNSPNPYKKERIHFTDMWKIVDVSWGEDEKVPLSEGVCTYVVRKQGEPNFDDIPKSTNISSIRLLIKDDILKIVPTRFCR